LVASVLAGVGIVVAVAVLTWAAYIIAVVWWGGDDA
jgi:hypothetical protein